MTEGSTVSLLDNKFIDNNFFGEGPVVIHNPNDLVDHSGNCGTKDDGVQCEFVHIAQEEGFQCIDFDTNCPGDPGNERSEAQTMSHALGISSLRAWLILFCVTVMQC